MVKDICSGCAPLSCLSYVMGNTPISQPMEPTDGNCGRPRTTSGTVMVKDIWSGVAMAHLGNIGVGNSLYFTAYTAADQTLWKKWNRFDTVMVKDINTVSGNPSYISEITPLGDTIYFEPMTESTVPNCGRAMERPQARYWCKISNRGPITAAHLNGSRSLAPPSISEPTTVADLTGVRIATSCSLKHRWATCSIFLSSTGLSMDSGTCTISGTPTVETSNTTTVTANISNVTYQGSVWLSTSPRHHHLSGGRCGAQLGRSDDADHAQLHGECECFSGSSGHGRWLRFW